MTSVEHDLIVIGGGSAGLVAAQVAAGIGARVAMVEREPWPGGDCLWTGCVPSKALISVAQRAADARGAREVGVLVDQVDIDFAAVMAAVRHAQERIKPHDSFERLEAAGITTIRGTGRVIARRQVEVTSEQGARRTITARHVLITAGSSPLLPPIPGIDQSAVLTTDDIWQLQALPTPMLIVGGGAVGCELGQALARLGSQVTIVEAAPRLLPREEPVASERVEAALRADGVVVHTGVGVDRLDAQQAQLADGTSVSFERAIIAIGRRPSACETVDESLRSLLDERGHIRVNARQRTAIRGIWAAGDVTGQLPFTNAAGLQGANAALNALLGTRRRFSASHVPWVTFTDPEVGRVGVTLEEARARIGDRAHVFELPLSGVDRAVTSRTTDGVVRLVTDRGRRLLGATVVGHGGGELMAELAEVIDHRRGIATLAARLHPYPTMGEATQRAALQLRRETALTPRVQRMLRQVSGVMSRFT